MKKWGLLVFAAVLFLSGCGSRNYSSESGDKQYIQGYVPNNMPGHPIHPTGNFGYPGYNISYEHFGPSEVPENRDVTRGYAEQLNRKDKRKS